MNFNNLLSKRILKISAFIFLSAILFGLLPIFVFESHPILVVADSIFGFYLSLAENITNYILQVFGSDVIITNGEIVFQRSTDYVLDNKEIIDNWTVYVLFKKWSALLLFLFWATLTSIRKKLIYTGFLFLTHFISLIGGLLIITAIGPLVVVSDSLTELRPNTFGALAMITLLVIWIKNNLPEIQNTINRLKIKLILHKRVMNEIMVIFFIYSLLKNFIVPYFNFYSYIDFLLIITKKVALIQGYDALIKVPYLIGNSGTLYMAKWCLGFLTMFTFAALVYLTGNKNKTKWIYIIAGIVFLHIVNIIRLAALFIFVQNNESNEMANDHHAIYNIIVYVIIFILWIIWFEKFADIKNNKTLNNGSL